MSQSTPIKIRAVPAADENICSFYLDCNLNSSGENLSLVIKADQRVEDFPLVESLREIPEIQEIFLQNQSITLRKSPQSPTWAQLGAKVGQLIRQALSLGIEKAVPYNQKQSASPLPVEASGASPSPDKNPEYDSPQDNPLHEKVQSALKSVINPQVASHGGNIVLKGMVGPCCYIVMEGGCQGCSQAMVTLKEGVEKTLLKMISGLEKVVDVTNHQSGQNPYFG